MFSYLQGQIEGEQTRTRNMLMERVVLPPGEAEAMIFPDFLAQYQAQEKGQGYFPFHFEGMMEEERACARAMLLERALGGDTVDLDGLRLIGDARTAARLEAAKDLDAAHGYRFAVLRLETLFVLTGDANHMLDLLKWIDGSDADAQELAALALARHPLPSVLARAIVERLADGRHEKIAGSLMDAWLATQGEPIWDMAVFQRHLPLIRRVLNARPAQRPRILADAF